MTYNDIAAADVINLLAQDVHRNNKKWWVGVSSVPFRLSYIAAGLCLSQPFSSFSDLQDQYVAGLFDGEGHIGLNKTNHVGQSSRYLSRCQIGSTDHELIETLKPYGGVVSEAKASRWNPNATDGWKWNIHSQQALKFLRRIGPLLRNNRKREAAQLVMAVEMSRLPKGGMCRWAKEPEIHDAREYAYQKVMELNSHRTLDGIKPGTKNLTNQLTDALIQIFDLSSGLGLDLGGAYIHRMADKQC